MLGDRNGVDIAGHGERNAALGQGRNIDSIIADAVASDDAQLRRMLQKRPVDRCGADHDAPCVAGLLMEVGGIVRPLDHLEKLRGAQAVEARITDFPQDQNFAQSLLLGVRLNSGSKRHGADRGAAADIEDLPGDEAGLAAEKEGDRNGDLVRFAETAHRHVGKEPPPVLLRVGS